MPPECEASETLKVSPPARDVAGAVRSAVGFARMVWRLGAVAAWTTLVYLVYMAGRLATRGRPAPRRSWRDRAVRRWSRGLFAILHMDLVVEGEPPTGTFLLVSNHLSYLDILALGGHAGARFVAKADIASWPVFGHLSKVADVIFVNRESRRDLLRVGDVVASALERGDSVIVFPEGTSTRGERVTRFKPSLLDYPARAGLPVHYACLTYRVPGSGPAADEVLCWWGDMELVGHLLELFRLPRFEARLEFGASPIEDSDRKRLACRLEQAVAGLFVPVVDSVEGA